MSSYRKSTGQLTHIGEALLAENVIVVIPERIKLYANQHIYKIMSVPLVTYMILDFINY
jgi:hypothetical protein